MSKSFKTIIGAWWPAALFMVFLSCISHIPGDAIHLPPFYGADKLIHFSVYLFMGLLIHGRGYFSRGFSKHGTMALPALIPGLAAGLTHAVGDEIHQFFIPLRVFSIGDIAANMLGLITGILVVWLVNGYIQKS